MPLMVGGGTGTESMSYWVRAIEVTVFAFDHFPRAVESLVMYWGERWARERGAYRGPKENVKRRSRASAMPG